MEPSGVWQMEHHDEKMMLVCKIFYTLIALVLVYQTVEDTLGKETAHGLVTFCKSYAYILIVARKGPKRNVHLAQNAQKPPIYWCFRELLMDFRGQ